MPTAIRFMLFIFLGSVIGACLGFLCGLLFGSSTLPEEGIIYAIIGLIGGGLIGLVLHLITRPSAGGSSISGVVSIGESNCFHERDTLVVPLVGAIFPNLCVKTGEPVNSADYSFPTELSPLQLKKNQDAQISLSDIAVRLAIGKVGAGAITAAKGLANSVRITYLIGLSQQHRTRRKRRTIVAAVLLLTFFPVLLLGAGVAELTQQKYGQPYMPAVFACIGLSALMFLCGIIAFAMRSSVLQILSCDGQYVWLAGAGANFLKQLPRFESEKTDGLN
ncbi:MAG: hypothetical protein U0930_05915 [Pirellulales bacterium]